MIGKLIVLVGLVPSLTVALVASLIHWAPGDLDPTFGGDGKVTTVFTGGDATAYALAIQPDGKIVAAGVADDAFEFARYNPDGSLDTTFGIGGRVTTDVLVGLLLGAKPALAFQSDGKIVAAAAADDAIVVARFNANGSLDTTFGTGGKVTTDVTISTDIPLAVAIQVDGKPVVAGTDYGRTGFVVRYNPDGTLDATFDGDGIVEEPETVYQALAIQSDGKIVAAGYELFLLSGGTGSVLTRYNANGSLDTYVSTGSSGGHDQQASAVAIQSDGKIVTAVLDFGPTTGVPPPPPPPEPPPCTSGYFTLVRSSTEGSLDTTFGMGGKVTTDFPGTCHGAEALAIQSDGKIVAAEGGDPFALARYNTDGSLDTTFGVGGKVTTDFPGLIATAYALAIQSDGNIVAAGTAGGAFALARYEGQASWACPQPQGYWKNNPNAWPVSNLTLGSQNYSQTELLIILNTPIGSGRNADASLILADQLIAAKLNIANVSDPAPVSTTITDANGLLSTFSGKLPYNVRSSSATGQSMVNDANTLSSYNNGALTSDCTP